MKQLAATVWLGLVLAHSALSQTSALYENDVQVLVPPNTAPQVDATNFVNTGLFSINFDLIGQQYQTANTLNYTNTGTMFCNNGFDLETFRNTGFVQMASNFFNLGIINCGTSTDSNIFNFSSGSVRMIVSASNIVNPGNINMGDGSLLSLTGQNVDLSRSMLTMAGQNGLVGNFANISSVDYGTGTCPVTNLNGYAWDPSANLGLNFADSSTFTNNAGLRNSLYLNSTPYVLITGAGTTNVIVRAIFLQNTGSNLSTRVFINSFDLGNVEWAGAYIDPETGTQSTNYFYLENTFSVTTNATVFGGIPSNFSFAQTTGSPLGFLGTPITAGLTNGVFVAGNVTNNYSYVSARVTSTSVATNTIVGGSVSNLSGRVQISAGHTLNMNLAQISGPDYLSVQCTNQFLGNIGGQISVPFADINLGVTNGFMTVSNLIGSSLPRWSGTVQAWNSRWISSDTNGVTYDYRVLLVDGELIPTAYSAVENLKLHATNSLIISDVFNILRSFSIDAQSLTLTTNGIGNGAASPDGELNLNSTTLSWAASAPNLRWLTNNGAIRNTNSILLQSFGSGLPGGNYFSFVNTGLIYLFGSKVWADNFASTGSYYNTAASFTLQSTNATIANGPLTAVGDISITTGSLNISNLVLQASRSLILTVTNLLTDDGVTNGNLWTVGDPNGAGSTGFVLSLKPTYGDLLGTTITNIVPPTVKQVFNTWAGQDRGASISGYSNNAAVGRLFLDSLGNNSQFVFNGTGGGSNALYVDYLELRDFATNRDANGNFPQITNANLIIYYAQAVINGVSIAEKMNHKNNDHLRWVPAYAGYYSSTNLIYGGTTNLVNVALAQSTHIDSDGDGIVNALDPTPFFLPSQVNLTLVMTNNPASAVVLNWNSIPNATNYVFYRTNLTAVNWQLLASFVTTNLPPSPPVTVTATDLVNLINQRYYQVRVNPQQP